MAGCYYQCLYLKVQFINFKIFIYKIFHFKLNNTEERAHACAALANLVLETDAVPSLMRHEIVRRVAPLILDKDEKVQETATGVLRYNVLIYKTCSREPLLGKLNH